MSASTAPPAGSADSPPPLSNTDADLGLPILGPGVPDLIPARMLNEFAYCPRLYYLEFVQGQFADSADTIEGRLRHRRADQESGDLPVPEPDDARTAGAEPLIDESVPASGVGAGPADREIHARSLMMSAPTLGLIARIDVIEAQGRRVTPVDYKKGAAPDHLPERAWEPDRVQICAQALILRENGFDCDEGVIYYAAGKTRVTVPITDDLVRRTLELRDQAHAVAAVGQIPPPLVDSPKCPGCSLVGICLPDETNALLDQERGAAREVRRLLPARIEAAPVYVQKQGASVGKSGDQLRIVAKDDPPRSIRLLDVSQLNLIGNVQVSSQALRELVARGIPVCYFTFGGSFSAITTGMPHKNVELRIRQYAAASNADTSLAFAKAIVIGKIRNCRTLLRRNYSDRPHLALRDLNDLRKRVPAADSLDSLLGLEGSAARIYFQHFAGMLKSSYGPPFAFDFAGRNRRPPRDPVNALLSFAYALLVKELTAALVGVGFDPFLGLYHRPRYGRPALALDLAEEFRPIIADSVVIQVINTGEIRPADFVIRANAAALRPAGRRAFLDAYERRLDSLVTHPMFGYTISYRRVLEVQARILAAHLAGELPHYVPFCTR
ncbi:MAG: CRISPR-associated exonuclease Cas4/endonuclease Cas1 fusion [Phycisphaerae bacterium]|nr:MAG: CRISPR-associated exonuclease Cas4/endonuclease Cas1 fusion [Phycisphaerae bacterium]